MNQIDQRFSSIGLLTYKFEMKFKKILLFLETMDDPELFFKISCFLEIEDLLALLATCKKLNTLKTAPIIQVRILRQKIKILQSPRQAFNSLSLLPGYYQFLLHQKQDEKQIPKNTQLFFQTIKDYKKAKDFIKNKKQISNNTNLQAAKILEDEQKYETLILGIQRQIQEQSKIYQPTDLAKEPEKKTEKPKSFVQKFRNEYAKIKQFQKKSNIRKLQKLHKKESQKVRIKKVIQTPFKSIPIIEIKQDQRISVVSVDSFYQTSAAKYLNRIKAILGLNIYY